MVHDLRRLIRDPALLRHALAWWPDYLAFKQQVAGWGPRPEVGRGGRRVCLVSLSNWIWQAKAEGVLASALRLRGCETMIITHRRCRRALRYFRAFGIKEFVWFEEFLSATSGRRAQEQAEALLARPLSVDRMKQMRYRGVQIGRQVLATISRFEHRQVELDDPAVQAQVRRRIREAVRGVEAAQQLVRALRPETMLFLDKDYTTVGPIYDVALNEGVDAIQWCGSHRDDALTLRRHTAAARNLHPQSLSAQTWERVTAAAWTERHETRVLQELRARYEIGGEAYRSYYNRPSGELVERTEVKRRLDLDADKPTAVIFAHILWDSTFFWGDDLFRDYAEWLVETVRAACKNPALNWIVKLHPANQWKLAREGVVGESQDAQLLEAQLGALPAHVQVLPPSSAISTGSLFGVTDYCLTVRGTIGIEMACYGVPVLTAGTGRYAGLGFTVDSGNREEYLARLARLQDLPPMRPDEIERARRYAYGLWLLRPWRLTTLRQQWHPATRKGGHPLDHNLQILAQSWEGLARAQDLRAFADWVCGSRAQDYVDAAAAGELEGAACAASSV